MEEWKIIGNFPNYEISNLGRVKSNSVSSRNLEGNGYILTPAYSAYSSGYLQVVLCADGLKKCKRIHRPESFRGDN